MLMLQMANCFHKWLKEILGRPDFVGPIRLPFTLCTCREVEYPVAVSVSENRIIEKTYDFVRKGVDMSKRGV